MSAVTQSKTRRITQQIASFRQRFGEAHLDFAYHAALPLALTPDLLYRLWANFQQNIHGEILNIPWIAVADLLLSSLCHEVGNELYEMDTAVRNQLLHELKTNPNFGQQRIAELSDFVLNYVHNQLNSPEPDIRDLAQTQRWTALAYTQPEQVCSELALAISTAYQSDRPDILRLASLVETLAEPLQEYEQFEWLLTYALGMASFVRGHLNDATEQLRKLQEIKTRSHNQQGLLQNLPSEVKNLLPNQSQDNSNPTHQNPHFKVLLISALLASLGGVLTILFGSGQLISVLSRLTPPKPTPTPTTSTAPTPTVTPNASTAPTPTVTPNASTTPVSPLMVALNNPVIEIPNASTAPTPRVTPTTSTAPTPTVTPTTSTAPTPTVTPNPSTTPTPTVTPNTSARLQGIDVAEFTGNVDWEKVKNQGISFAYAQVNNGTKQDSQFASYWPAMKKAGIIRGAYFIFRPTEDIDAQVKIFAQSVNIEAGDLPPVVDIESDYTRQGQDSWSNLTLTQRLDRVAQVLSAVEVATGYKPIIYTGPSFWREKLGNTTRFADYPLWIAHYQTNTPSIPGGWKTYILHQYIGDQTGFPGIQGDLDRNRFNGTLDDLRRFTIAPAKNTF